MKERSRQLVELSLEDVQRQQNALQSERKMNRTLTALLVAYTVFITLPFLFLMVVTSVDQLEYARSISLPVVPIGIGCNSMINFFVYIFRHDELKECIIQLLHCQT